MLVASIESFSDKGELRRLRVFGPSIVHPRNSNSEIFEHFIEFTIYYARMGDQDVIEIGIQVRFEAENALANAPFDPVPPCMAPDLLGGRDSESSFSTVGNDAKTRGRYSFSRLEDGLEFRLTQSSFRQRSCGDPSLGVASKCFGHRWCACGCGTRGSCSGGGYWVGRSFSSF